MMDTQKENIIKEFIEYCVLSQKDLKSKLMQELKTYYKKVKFEDGFVFARGNMPVMLVAHMDTVHKTQCNVNDIYVNLNGSIVKSDNGIGGDDRCGIFMIMDILKNTNFRPFVLFVEDEEIGGVGNSKFLERYNYKNLELNFIIELDRANCKDSVYYQLDNKDFENYINKFGFKTAIGSYTDICDLCPDLKCAGVNLSCGYYKAHTTNEYVNITEMLATTYKVIRILEDFNPEDKFEYIAKPYVSQYRTTYYGDYYRDYYSDYKYNPYYVDVNTKTYYCDYCGAYHFKDEVHEDESGFMICKDCMKRYGMKECEECGKAMLNNSNGKICSECKQFHTMFDLGKESDV